MWPFKSTPKPERKSLVLGTSHELGSFLIFGRHGAATASSALSLYDKSTAVSIPINMIAEAFASIEPVVKINQDIISTDHPVLDLLRSPSPYFNKSLFFETLAKHYLITANAYIVALGNVSRPPLELQPISPGNTSDVEGGQGLVVKFIVSGNTLSGSYELDKDNRAVRYLRGGLAELKQIRGFSIKNNSLLRGRSPLVSASAEVRQHILGNTHNVSMLERGGRVSLVFHFKAEQMFVDDFEAAKERIKSAFGGASKAGEIGVTSGGEMDIKELGTNNKDMDFAKLQTMAKQSVALQYKVPLPLISVEASTFSNVSTSRLALYDDAVLPLADRIFGGLTELLIPRYKQDPSKVVITYDLDSITALSVRRNEELKLRRDLNIETLNEFRTAIGREAVEGGDVVLAPATMVPVGTDLFTDDNEPVPEPTLARDEEVV